MRGDLRQVASFSVTRRRGGLRQVASFSVTRRRGA